MQHGRKHTCGGGPDILPEFVPVRKLREAAQKEVASWVDETYAKVLAENQLNLAAVTAAEFDLEIKVGLCFSAAVGFG